MEVGPTGKGLAHISLGWVKKEPCWWALGTNSPIFLFGQKSLDISGVELDPTQILLTSLSYACLYDSLKI